MSRTVVWDVDDVLFAWRKGFGAWMTRNGHKSTVPVDQGATFSGIDSYPSLEIPQIRELCRVFNSSPDFRRLELTPMAEEAYRTVRRAAGAGSRFIAITAAGTDPAIRAGRLAQLERFDFDEIRILDLGESKLPHLRELSPDAIIDDSPSVGTEALAAGLPLLIKDMRYNRHIVVPESRRIYSWETCTHKVLAQLGLSLAA